MTPRRSAALAVGLCLAAVAAEAQRLPELRVEGGFASIEQRDVPASAAALLALLWRPATQRVAVVTSANLTYAQDSLAAAQGVAALDIPWGRRERHRTEVGVAGASFSLRTAGRGGNANAFARQHLVGQARGAWLGTTQGNTRRDGVFSRSSALDAGIWARRGPLYASASVARVRSGDWPLLLAAGVIRDNPADETFDLRDIQLTAQLRRGPHDLALAYVARRGLAGTSATFQALSGNGTLQVTDRIAILGSLGRQLADPLRGLPQATVFTTSVRVSLGPKPLPVVERSWIAQTTLDLLPRGGAQLTVRVFAADTMRVVVAGDFSDWRPLALEREGAFWVARTQLLPGRYRIGVRVNEGQWRAPRNLARVRDDYGGEAGLLVVPSGRPIIGDSL